MKKQTKVDKFSEPKSKSTLLEQEQGDTEEFASELSAMESHEGSEGMNRAWEQGTATPEQEQDQAQAQAQASYEGDEAATIEANAMEENGDNGKDPYDHDGNDSYLDEFDNAEPLEASPSFDRWNEEYAAELTANDRDRNLDPAWGEAIEEDEAKSEVSWIGWIALATGIISFFMYPAFLAPVAIIGGIISFYGGNRTLGGWSVAAGVASLIAYVVFLPFFTF